MNKRKGKLDALFVVAVIAMANAVIAVLNALAQTVAMLLRLTFM